MRDGGDASPRKIVAVVVSYGSPDQTADCLNALARSTHPFHAAHVCENGGPACHEALLGDLARLGLRPRDGGTRPAPRATRTAILDGGAFPVLVHEAEGNLGYAGGVNLCLAAIAGEDWDAVLVLNPDAIVDPGALAALVERARDPAYGAIGCRLILAETGRVQMYGGRWRPWIARTRNLGFGIPEDAPVDAAGVERDCDFVCGAAMYVTRAFVEAVGPMEEDYFLYMEEVDWCFRRGRFRLGYAHDAVVRHIHGVSTGASTRPGQRSHLSIYLSERNKLRFTRKYFPLHYPVAALATLAFILLYLKRGDLRQVRVGLSGWLAGLRGETGPPPGPV